MICDRSNDKIQFVSNTLVANHLSITFFIDYKIVTKKISRYSGRRGFGHLIFEDQFNNKKLMKNLVAKLIVNEIKFNN